MSSPATSVLRGARRVLTRWRRVAESRVRRWWPAVALVVGGMVVTPAVVLAVTGSAESARDAGQTVLIMGGCAVTLLLASGGYGTERRSGGAVLWLQKPVSPTWLYLDRFVARLGIVVLAALVMGSVLAAWSLGLGSASGVPELRGGALSVALLFATLAAMVHGISSLGVPREELFGLLAFVAASLVAVRVETDPLAFGAARPLARVVAIPIDSIEPAGGFLAGLPVHDGAGHLAAVLAYAGGWVMLGMVASALTTRRPLASSDD